jgi:hypothetical protein
MEQWLPGTKGCRDEGGLGRGWSMNTELQLDRRNEFWHSIVHEGDQG